VKKTVIAPDEADAAAELLRDLRISSSVLCRSIMTPPWGFGVASRDLASFHVVLSGQGYLVVESSNPPVAVGPGDVVILPKGDAHWMKDAPATAAPWLTAILDRNHVVDGELRFGGDDGPSTEIVCGVFSLEGTAPAWFERLPAIVLSRGEGADRDNGAQIAGALRDEARDPTRGGAVVVNRLLEALLAAALRREVTGLTVDVAVSGRAIADRRVGAALARLNDAPEDAWTVEQMAKVATMSRSAFADGFRSLVGVSPMRYLTELRLARAARLLRTSEMSTAEVARRVGYGSDDALARPFRRRFGLTPATYRKSSPSRDGDPAESLGPAATDLPASATSTRTR
jgi:AraC-like DNA-binding protein